jgi:diguanylate cyclase (GGDEF)-like protein
VRQSILSTTLRTQFLGLLSGCVICTSAGATLLGHSATSLGRLLAAIFLGAGSLSFVLSAVVVSRVIRSLQALRGCVDQVIAGNLSVDPSMPPSSRDLAELHADFRQMVLRLRQGRADHEQSQRSLADRTRTMDRLLEFSQTIQGAGKVEQIFPTLCHFLASELKLSGVAVLGSDTDPTTNIQIRACCPEGILGGPISEFDTALCPCLRQSQPRLFKSEGAAVRCTIDQYLSLPQSHEAYCVPFNVGRRSQVVLHMLLPEGQTWTDERRQLAQTYANTAQSSLTSLHLLAEAEKQSMTDALTGLYNRRSLDQLLSREVALAERHKQPLSIVMIDMDYFKQVNDAHGHAAGDHLLRAFADCVRITLRKTDLAFRYGGDEFAIALPQTTAAQAQQVVQKLRQAFASVDFSSAIANLQQQPTLSIGLAERSATLNLLTLPALLSAADQALYDAKSGSRNCVRVYQPPRAA